MPAFTRRALLANMATSAVAGWAFPVRGESSRAEIEVMGSPYIKDVHEGVKVAFDRLHPGIAVTLRMGQREDDATIKEVLRAALVKDGVPDVLFINGNLTRLLVERGLVVRLDAMIGEDPEWKNLGFATSVAAAGQVAGKTYGTAFGLSLPVVLFNDGLVRRAGHDPRALPADWPGILALAQKIAALDPSLTGGFLEYDNNGAFSFLALINSFGVPAMTEDEKAIGFDNERGVAALQVLAGFAAAGQGAKDMTRQQARQAFGAGAMGALVTMSSTIAAHEKAAAGRFEVVSVPYPLAPGGWLPTAGPIAMMLTQDPVRQKAAFDYMKFASGAEAQTILATNSGYAPVNDIAIRSSAHLADVLAARKNAHSYLARVDTARNWYAFPGRNSVKITERIKDHLQQVATARLAPDEAVSRIAADVVMLLG